jgi:Holliday junction resolvase
MMNDTNRSEKFCSYQFGREAEYIVAIFLKSRGWKLSLSKGSRGAADIIAIRNSIKWLIQVKSSNLIPRIRGYEIKRLTEAAKLVNASAVIATLQPSQTIMNHDFGRNRNSHINDGVYHIGIYSLIFYLLPNWSRIS